MNTAEVMSLSDRAVDLKVPLEQLLEEETIAGPRYDARLNDHPLVFQHIPKTAGASIIQAIESYFDDAAICNAFNPPDFVELPLGTKYQLYRGHLLAYQFPLFPADSELFTILREPVDYTFSMYEWTSRFQQADWDEMWSANARGDESRGEDRHNLKISVIAGERAREMSLPDLLRFNESTPDSLRVRAIFWCPYLRSLTMLASPAMLEGLKFYLPEVESRIEAHFASAMAYLKQAVAIGDFSRLESGLLALCYRRGWPAPPPLPTIHNYGRLRADDATLAAVDAAIREESPYEHALYGYGAERARAEEEELFAAADGDGVRAFLDKSYETKFFATAPQTLGFHLAGDRAWGGCGWGLRERHVAEVPLRTFAAGGSASLFARLARSLSYQFTAEVFKAETMADIEGIDVTANGRRLERGPIGYTPRGTVLLTFDVPANLVAESNGDLALKLTLAPTTDPGSLYIASVSCQPSRTLAAAAA